MNWARVSDMCIRMILPQGFLGCLHSEAFCYFKEKGNGIGTAMKINCKI